MGLKRHQRSCKTVKSFAVGNANALNDVDDGTSDGDFDPNSENSALDDLQGDPSMKPGVFLPKSDAQWDTANSYFHAHLPACSEISDSNLDEIVSWCI